MDLFPVRLFFERIPAVPAVSHLNSEGIKVDTAVLLNI